MRWKIALLLAAVGAIALAQYRPTRAEAANFGATKCIGSFCCRAELFDGVAFTSLWNGNNLVSSSQYKVRERVTCNGTLHYSDFSVDNNCGNNCESASIAVPCASPSSNVCNIYTQ